ncbi:hypothetical protein PWT90_04591 [Aphanocladium album]|nr:hypothetical protein PWT90_04591 [Aphanocladium album]
MSPLLFQNILSQIQTMNDVLASYRLEFTAAAELCDSSQLQALEDALHKLCEHAIMAILELDLRIPADVQARTALDRAMLARDVTAAMDDDVRPRLEGMALSPLGCQTVTESLRAIFTGRLPRVLAPAGTAAEEGGSGSGSSTATATLTTAEKLRRRRHCHVLSVAPPAVILTFAVAFRVERWTAMETDLFYPLIERITQSVSISRRPWYLLEMVSLFTTSSTGQKVSLRDSNVAYDKFMKWFEGLPTAPRTM